MSAVFSDFRDAVRQLCRAPGFSLLAIGLLAVGLGTTTAIFSLFHSIVLRPLPFRAPHELVGLRALNPPKTISQNGHSATDFRDYAERAKSFNELTAYRPNFAAYTAPGEASAQLVTSLVTESFFSVFNIPPALGRTFAPTEFSAAAPRVVVLSDTCWRRLFNQRADVLGRTITLDDEIHTVIGVMPPTFREPEFVEAWLPFPRESGEYYARDSRFWNIVGRLGSGATLGAAQAELAGIAADLARQHPVTNRHWTVAVLPLHELRTSGVRAALLLLIGAVGLVLVISCLNLANLILARDVTRSPELAVRLALGATPQRLARRAWFESILLAVAGGAAGCGLTAVMLPVLATRLPEGVIVRSHEIALYPPALAFAFAASLTTGLLFGWLPALQVRRTNLNELLKSGGRGQTSSFAGRVQRGLVSGQIALSVIVLVASLLLVKSLMKLQATPTGFNASGVLTLRLAPPPSRYETNLELAQYYERLVAEASGVPGVMSAAVNASAPFSGISLKYPFWVHGRPRTEVGADEMVYAPVTEQFFATLQLPLKAGRLFTARDDETGAPVAVINETLARRIFPGENPIGQRVLLLPWLSQNKYREIVGVVGDSRQDSLAEPPPAQIYVPQRQMPWFFSTLLVRTTRPGLASALRLALQRADPTLPFAPTSLEENIALTATQPRLYTLLFGAFAAAGLALSAFGIFASLRFLLSQRTRELGVRLALGATPASITRLVLSSAGRLAAWGLAGGLIGAIAVSRLLRGLLHGVQLFDPAVYVALALVMPLVLLAAAAPTAWQAARITPTRALQHE